ncbi:hypothetical protein A9Q68_09645 [Streptococcus bovimastitidis]|uniref:Uncharacterized protein n=1 Tax=Streptococcus bovimastitidis TaxID=1856638 RepID=A0A1L8MLB0_9STRE|nr:hypothetical protein A9Q68_09645 [Streptococcus bovimastitidis]
MQKMIKQFCYINLLWLILFLIDYGIELFQVNNSERITVMGLYIKSAENSNGLYTVFGLTYKILIIYLIMIFVWLGIYYVLQKWRKRKLLF